MGIVSQIKNGGWGALALYLYSLFVILQWDLPLISSDRVRLAVAAVPALVIMFTVVVINDWLNDFWAGGNLKRSTETIDRITGNSNFYHSASEEIQDAVDEFDEKAFSHHISIIAGILISLTVPITAYLAAGLKGVIIGLILSATLFRTLAIRSYHEVNRLAKDLSTPYEENYENQ